MTLQIKAGARLRSAVCEVEVIAVKAPPAEVDLRCGGVPMLGMESAKPEGGTPAPGFDGGTLLGKRYTNLAGDLELLCTKAGPSSLSLGDDILEIKDAKPLPSSD
jgi:hypothetical protein